MNKNQHKPKITQSEIISCSRRTDVPAFLMDWVIERMHHGYVDVVNPFNKNQVSRVLLGSENVKCWVWWSKNFRNWIDSYKRNKSLFNSYKGHYFQFTINSPSELEANLQVSLKERISQLKWLKEKFGSLSISFRFDPIIVWQNFGNGRIYSNLNKFEYIIKRIAALGLDEMIFSFATIYSKVKKRMKNRAKIPIELNFKKKKEILDRLIVICKKHNMNMKACCQPELLKIPYIKQAHCIDANKIETLIGETITKKKDYGQRDACGCHKSRDIGGYYGRFRCKHNCDYCYASPAKK